MFEVVVKVLDYAIEQAEALDKKLHELGQKVDAATHAALEKLKALRERFMVSDGVAAKQDCYQQLSAEDQKEVDDKVQELRGLMATE